MKSYRFLLLRAVLLAALPAVLPAAETVKIQPVLYVFKDAAFDHVSIGAEPPASSSRGGIFSAPVNVTFDQQALALNGSEYTWNGGGKVPAQFSVAAMPTMINFLGQSAAILCAAPTQYLEKMADGSLKVRGIPRDSPDMPHYQLTLTVRSGAATGFVTACELDVVTLLGREKIPGVDLEIGRPILARFKDSVEIPNLTGVWSGLLLRRPGGSDYSLLMLLKVTRGDEAGVSATTRSMKVTAPPK